MKSFIRILGFSLLILLSASAHAASYSNASTTYGWITPTTNTDIVWTSGCSSGYSGNEDDAISAAIPLPFTFSYGGTGYTSVQVSSNGRLQFAGNTYCGTNSIPSKRVNRAMAPANGIDLDMRSAGSGGTTCSALAASPNTCFARYGSSSGVAPNRQFVVSFVGVPKFNAPTLRFTYQIVLNEDGSFVYQYNTLGPATTVIPAWQLTTADYAILTTQASSTGAATRFYIPAPPTPLGYYDLDQPPPWIDASGTASANATATSTGVSSTAAKICNGASIASNTSSSVYNAVSTPFTLGSASLKSAGTISFWWKSSTAWNAGTAAQILDATTANNNWFYLARTSGGKLYFRLTDSNGTARSSTSSTQSFAANTWKFITLTWDFPGARMGIYVDGILLKSTSLTTSRTLSTSIGSLYIGDNRSTNLSTNGTGNSATGLIDEIRVYNAALSTTAIAATMAATHSCVATLHHIRLEHDGTASTCAPEVIKVIACADASCATYYTGGVSNINLTPTSTVTWSPGTTVSIPAGSSSTNVTIAYASAFSTTLGTTGTPSPAPTTTSDCYNTGTSALTCAFNFGTSLGFDLPNHTAGTPQVATICGNSSFSGKTRSVKFWSTYVDAATGTKQGRILDASSGTTNCSSAAPAGSVVGTTSGTATTVPLVFTSTSPPQATISFCYPDVGKVKLDARYDGSASNTPSDAGTTILGNANFIASPYTFTVTGTGIPGASNSSGTAFATAGNAFSATVNAVNKYGDITPNFGKEATAEGVTLMSTVFSPTAGSDGLLSCNASTSDCIIGGSLFSSGSKALTDFIWSEVGVLKIKPLLTDGNYLGAGDIAPTAPDDKSVAIGRFIPHHFTLQDGAGSLQARNGRAGCWGGSSSDTGTITSGSNQLTVNDATQFVSGSGMVIVGAGASGADLWATASSIDTATNIITLANNAGSTVTDAPVFQKVGYSYMAEGMLLGFSLIAKNTADNVTTNYSSDTVTPTNDFNRFSATEAKVIATGNDSWGLAMVGENPFVELSGRALAVPGNTPSITWNAGVGDFVTNVQLNQPDTVSTAKGPFSWLALGIWPLDKDGAGLLAADKDLKTTTIGSKDKARVGVAEVKYGRIKLSNAYGSERLPLTIPMTVQYYNGSFWATSIDDNCTPLGRDNTITHPTTELVPNPAALSTAASQTVTVAAAGKGNINLSAPNSSGYAVLTWPVKPYMQFTWITGGAAIDPSSRATFGIFKSPILYLRESY